MFDPHSPSDLKKLDQARKASEKQLESFRSQRATALRQFVGKHYGNRGAPDKVPFNFVLRAAQTMVRKLASRNPRCRCESKFNELLSSAQELADAINESIVEIGFDETQERLVLDAMFGMGIAKIGITSTSDDTQGYQHDYGEVFVDTVDLSDWVHDMNAKRREAWQFCGDRYELPLDTVLETELFDPVARQKVQKKSAERQFSVDNHYDPHEMEQGQSKEDNSLYDMVELWDLWIPRSGVIVTYCEDCLDYPLRVVQWDGPENGPYRLLSYQQVPNCVMPLPPVMNWIDLHEAMNELGRKAIRQAIDQKTNTYFTGSAQHDAERLRDAGDREIIRMDDSNSIKTAVQPGADAGTVAMIGQLQNSANYYAGNIEVAGGLKPQSGTVGQDKLLGESVSEMISEAQEKTERYIAGCLHDVGYWLFSDPQGIKAIQRRMQGTNLSQTTYWGPEKRVGKFYQYNITVVPYSLRPQSPEQKLVTINAILDRFMPALQLMMQQGITIDFQKLIDIVAENSDTPELTTILVPMEPVALGGGGDGGGGGPKMPRNSVRETFRSNNSGQQMPFQTEFPSAGSSQPQMM